MAEVLQPVTRECSWYSLPCNLDAFGDWFYDFAMWLPRKIFEGFVEGSISAVDLVPCAHACFEVAQAGYTVLSGSGVPDYQGQGGVLVSWLGQMVYYTALATGIELVMCALLARFLLRRIPLIG